MAYTPDENYAAPQAVRIKEGDDSFFGVTTPELDDLAFFAKLSKEEKRKVLAGETTVAALRPVRDEEPVDDLETLREMTQYVRHWKSKLSSTDDARRALAVKLLIEGTDPVEVQEAVDVNYHVLKSWLFFTVDDKKKPIDKKLTQAVEKAEKAAKNS